MFEGVGCCCFVCFNNVVLIAFIQILVQNEVEWEIMIFINYLNCTSHLIRFICPFSTNFLWKKVIALAENIFGIDLAIQKSSFEKRLIWVQNS